MEHHLSKPVFRTVNVPKPVAVPVPIIRKKIIHKTIPIPVSKEMMKAYRISEGIHRNNHLGYGVHYPNVPTAPLHKGIHSGRNFDFHHGKNYAKNLSPQLYSKDG